MWIVAGIAAWLAILLLTILYTWSRMQRQVERIRAEAVTIEK